jgi:hypothetical protein
MDQVSWVLLSLGIQIPFHLPYNLLPTGG